MSFIKDTNVSYFYGFNEKPEEIKKKCETNYVLDNKAQTLFDSSSYGSLSDVCLNSDCKYVIKLIKITNSSDYKDFIREALISSIASRKKIGPKIYDIYTCLNFGYIIMDRWDGSIKNLITKNLITTERFKKILDTIKNMHNIGIIHNDLHIGNILYKIDNNNYTFCITDFGLSSYFENKNVLIPDEYLPRKDFTNIFYPAFDYYRYLNSYEFHKKDHIFITYPFNNNYISFLDYTIVDKFKKWNSYDVIKYGKNNVRFNDYLNDLELYVDINNSNKKNKNKSFNKSISKHYIE